MNYAKFATFARWVRVRVSVRVRVRVRVRVKENVDQVVAAAAVNMTNSVVYSTNANVSALTISAVSADHQRCQR